MKKLYYYIIGVIIILIFLIYAIPAMVFGAKVRHLQGELTDLKTERSKCEIVQSTNHDKAIAVRAELDDLLGTTVFQSGVESMPNSQTTPIQQMDNYLTGTIGG